MENWQNYDETLQIIHLEAMAMNQINLGNGLNALIEKLAKETQQQGWAIKYFWILQLSSSKQRSEKKHFTRVSYDDIDLILAINDNNTYKYINTLKDFLQANGEIKGFEIKRSFEVTLQIASILFSQKRWNIIRANLLVANL